MSPDEWEFILANADAAMALWATAITVAFSYVAAWEFKGVGNRPRLHREDLDFEYVKLTQRSYK